MCICRLSLICWLLLSCVVTEMACAQPLDLRVQRVEGVEDYDFSWVVWFETRGQRYMYESLGDRPLPWDTPATRRWRGEVVAGLEALLEDEDDRVRGAAVLALAKLGHWAVLDRLLPWPSTVGGQSLLQDASAQVRVAAWAALGVLGGDDAAQALVVTPGDESSEVDRVAQAMAIGLLSAHQQAHAAWLIDRLREPEESLEVKRWCLWSLRRLQIAFDTEAVYDTALRVLPSVFVTGEVLLDNAYVQSKGGSDWLVDVLRYHPDVRSWAGYRSLSAMPVNGVFGSSPRRLGMETRVAASLSAAELPLIEDREELDKLLLHLRRRMVAGNSAQAMDFNRGFDTLAYFMHCRADTADQSLLYDLLRGYAVLPPDDPEVTAELDEGEVPTQADLRKRQDENEVRSYAALSAGLLIRRVTEGTRFYNERPIQGLRVIEVERIKRRFGRRLMRAVADGREPMGYRAACALALGLSGDRRYRAELSIELSKLRGGDEAVLGYGLLALSMLGEERVASPASRYLTRPGAVAGDGDWVGRRAALRAVGLLDWNLCEAGRSALKGVWGRDPWVAMESGKATAWVGHYDAVPAMLKATQSESANWRWAAAHALGDAFERSFPSRLSPLIERYNPTMSFRPRIKADAKPQPEGVVAEAEPEAEFGAGWPMGRLYALADPFVFERLREAEEQPATPAEDIPPGTSEPVLPPAEDD